MCLHVCTSQFKPHHKTERRCDVLDCTLEFEAYHRPKRGYDFPEVPQSQGDNVRGSLHLSVTWYPYTREQILEKRGCNETEKMIYEEQKILAAEKDLLAPHKRADFA